MDKEEKEMGLFYVMFGKYFHKKGEMENVVL